MSDYKMTVYADPKGPTGHFSVSVSGPGLEKTVQGKYPGQGGKKLPFGEVDGEIRDDSERVNGEGVVHKEILLTGEQAIKVRDYMGKAKGSPDNYQILDKNCVDYVQGALEASGTKIKLADHFDQKDLDSMGWVVSAARTASGESERFKKQINDNPIDAEIGGWPDSVEEGKTTKPDQGEDKITGASGADELDSGETGKQSYSPEIDNFLQELKKPGDPVSEILLKEPASWTEQEVNQVHGSDAYQSLSDPRRNEAMYKVKDWYGQHYGNDQVKVDDTGKTVPPTFVKAPQKKPVPAMGKDGKPVMDGVLGAGAKIADVAGKNGLATAIRGAQIGVNLLNKFEDGNKGRAGAGSLKTDGIFGPKTNKALRDSVAGVGRPTVENALSLGTFQNLLEKKPGGLAEAAHDSFSGLFQKPSSFKATDKSPTPWGMVVQDTLNDIGGDRYRSLKSDGWIGPKTTDAFRHMVKPTGVGGFMQKLGANFGFF